MKAGLSMWENTKYGDFRRKIRGREASKSNVAIKNNPTVKPTFLMF